MDNFNGDEIGIEIFNELGEVVYTETISEMKTSGYIQKNINLSVLNEGMYFIRVVSENKSVTKRIVIQ